MNFKDSSRIILQLRNLKALKQQKFPFERFSVKPGPNLNLNLKKIILCFP